MFCPQCQNQDTKVLESRTSQDGAAIRRRRACPGCGYRFTTYEKEEELNIRIAKKDGRFEAYSRTKLLKSIHMACQKRPISPERIDSLVKAVEKELQNFGKSITSAQLGDILIVHLKDLDHVAYVRFASVYKDFKSTDEFMQELKSLGPIETTERLN